MGAFFPRGFVLLILVVVVVVVLCCSSCSSDAEVVVTVDVVAARGLLLNRSYLFLDVRTQQEFNNFHLENASNIPYMINTPKGMLKNPNFMDQVLSLFGNDDRLVVGCRSGVRSLKAATDMVVDGFNHVYNMGGGYNAWIQNGFQVHKLHTLDQEL